MSGQKITIEVHDREKQPSHKVQVKENTKAKEKLKKDADKLGIELKDFGTHFYKMFVSFFKVLLFSLAVLGDLLLMLNSGKKNNTGGKEKPKKNILDEGW